MTSDLESISSPARVANPEEGISADELQLAARNHGMPLESLRWDVTPPGLHYLLIHYDIPAIDPSTYELIMDGLVDTPLSLNLEALQSRPQDLICGNARVRGKWPCAVATASRQPAVAERGRRHRPLDRHVAVQLAAGRRSC